jgi:hypothetical protein
MIDWLLSEKTLGVVVWIGLILGLLGLYITYRQAEGAKTAAETAAKAVKELEGRLNISHLAYANAQLEAIRQLATQANYGTAMIILAPVKRTIVHACLLLPNDEAATANAAVARRNLNRIEVQLTRGGNIPPGFNANVFNRSLQGLTEFLAEWEGRLTFGR